MQEVSDEYKESMKQPLRNRGYLKATLGLINQEAQDDLTFDNENNNFIYFSNPAATVKNVTVNKVYATAEQDFSSVNGSMYFAPAEDECEDFYNNGIVTTSLIGSVYVDFSAGTTYTIKGLTIDFGVCYPTEFTITWDSGTTTYTNHSQLFITTDTFEASYFVITAISMVGGQDRFRINSFLCGLTLNFDNSNILSYSLTDYVSATSETVPSLDMSLTVDNQDQTYCPDDDNSIFAFLEQGQPMTAQFGYDVNGEGDIEWLPKIVTYLSSWSATDVDATFGGTDIFDYELQGTYFKGKYSEEGTTLYDIAVDVFTDAGLVDGEYEIDSYLKKVIINNPMPVCTYAEALQIIANAGRCALKVSRNDVIALEATFVPDVECTVNNKTSYSNIDKLLKIVKKDGYAEASENFTRVDGSEIFYPEDAAEVVDTTGYVSESMYIDDAWTGDAPLITINFEDAWTFYGLMINFRSLAPEEFTITSYNGDTVVEEYDVTDSDVVYSNTDTFDEVDKIVIEIVKGTANSRVFIDSIIISSITDYRITRDYDLTDAPTAERLSKIKSINVVRNEYSSSDDIVTATVAYDVGVGTTTEYVTLDTAGYDFTVTVSSGDATVEITDSGAYFLELEITSESEQSIELDISGSAYAVTSKPCTVNYNTQGEIFEWTNPLISDSDYAAKVNTWLAGYYLGNVDYTLSWRADPRVDANDLFFLELKGDRDDNIIRAYQSTFNYNGGWSGELKARKAVEIWL